MGDAFGDRKRAPSERPGGALESTRRIHVEQVLLVPDEMPLAEYLKELTSPPRPSILRALDERPMYVTELTDVVDRAKGTLSRHLRTLEELGVVRPDRSPRKWKYYHLTGGVGSSYGWSHRTKFADNRVTMKISQGPNLGVGFEDSLVPL